MFDFFMRFFPLIVIALIILLIWGMVEDQKAYNVKRAAFYDLCIESGETKYQCTKDVQRMDDVRSAKMLAAAAIGAASGAAAARVR